MKSSKWHNPCAEVSLDIVTTDFSMFNFEKSIVKYDASNTTNTYMGKNGVIVLAQESIEIGGDHYVGPFHSIGHFLESPDKYCNKPYFGIRKDSPNLWYREGVATLIHVAALKACGREFTDYQWDQINGTLEWHLRVKFGASKDGLTPTHLKPLVRAHIGDLFIHWTKERIFREWRRKNRLIREIPKEPYVPMRWGMMGAVAA